MPRTTVDDDELDEPALTLDVLSVRVDGSVVVIEVVSITIVRFAASTPIEAARAVTKAEKLPLVMSTDDEAAERRAERRTAVAFCAAMATEPVPVALVAGMRMFIVIVDDACASERGAEVEAEAAAPEPAAGAAILSARRRARREPSSVDVTHVFTSDAAVKVVVFPPVSAA